MLTMKRSKRPIDIEIKTASTDPVADIPPFTAQARDTSSRDTRSACPCRLSGAIPGHAANALDLARIYQDGRARRNA